MPAWVRSPLGEFLRFVFSPGVVEPVPKVERVPLKKKTQAMSPASESEEMPAMCDHAVDGSEKGDTTIDDIIAQDRRFTKQKED
uniref:Uncharacterized protein n=1 Tax=Trichogramma kaykai TaxID=54128 RepID=A0ABD2X5V2_9HYME